MIGFKYLGSIVAFFTKGLKSRLRENYLSEHVIKLCKPNFIEEMIYTNM